ncbi:MAG: hypothetical protein IT578_10665 [Verrucomicrobiae bacterium]|nr:hypothetical protein [Verrucomicrobiae bacterium]
MKKRVVVAGFMSTCPIAGVVWQHIHYLVGLKRLGWDVAYIEDSARHPYNAATFESGEAAIPHAIAVTRRLAERFGFRWAYRARFTEPMKVFGDFDASGIARAFAEADFTFNLCGAQELHDEVLKSRGLVYVESDPGVEQIKLAQGAADTAAYLRAHRALFTFGENLGRKECPLPNGGFAWHPTRQPVVCDFWEAPAAKEKPLRFTTVANWETKGKDITWKNQVYYWSKTFEFLKFSDMPAAVGRKDVAWELATDMSRDPASQALFERQGWRLVSPHGISTDFDAYVRYIQGSSAEWTVAKDQYLRLKTGWFSDRTACYLAAGRPAIVQDTSFGGTLPVGKGLFAFQSAEDVRAAVEALVSDYEGQCLAAREIAREYFEAEKVIAAMLAKLGR